MKCPAVSKDLSKLSKNQLDIVNNPQNELFISEASFFEMAIKIRLSKPDFGHIDMINAENFRKKIGIQVLKSKFEHYDNIVSIPQILKKDGKAHADPFNLLIISTALTEKLPILSSDSYFPNYSLIKTIS